jgi:hypothetical protein
MFYRLLTEKPMIAKNDCRLVKLIYHKMGGDVNSIPSNCCQMPGITCADGHVTKIYWSHKSLTGSIPSELGNLVHLESL